MKIYHLDKSILLFKNKAADFLNAYTSNTLQAPKNAFLDIRGRIVAVCDQKLLNSDEVLVVIERPFKERLLKHLEKYLMLGDTTVVEQEEFAYFDLEKGEMTLSNQLLPSTVSENEWKAYRLEHFMPVQGIDFDDEMLLNVFDEGYVSYTKGCYLGQEIIARVHYKGKPPRKLVVERDPQTGKAIGFVFTVLK